MDCVRHFTTFRGGPFFPRKVDGLSPVSVFVNTFVFYLHTHLKLYGRVTEIITSEGDIKDNLALEIPKLNYNYM